VIDYADPSHREALGEVEKSLTAISADQIPRLFILNKIDLLDGSPVEPFPSGRPDGDVVAVSATTGIGIDRLVTAIVAEASAHRLKTPDRHSRARRTGRARTYYERRDPTK
jgi:50S ribosomal subunit-associated GTPase HflX